VKLKLAILAVAALAVMAFAIPSVASAAGQARLGAGLVMGAPAHTDWKGMNPPRAVNWSAWQSRINSPTGKCAWKRLVTVWWVRPGADKKMGSARSKRHVGPTMTSYDWILERNGNDHLMTRTQRYYAKMAATSKCDADRAWLPRARIGS
jgi:hypothetical protein